MADATTLHYNWAYPTNGADGSSWGSTLNAAIIAIDAQMYANAQAAMPTTGGQFSGPVTFNGASASGGGGFPYFVDPSNTSGRITVSTAAPSGTPSNGDIWFQHN